MKKFAILMSVLMLMGLSSGVAMAKTKAVVLHTMIGFVAKVDAQAGTITLKYGKRHHALKAEPKMLEGITVGTKVEVKRSGNVIQSLKVLVPAKTMKAPEKKTEAPKAMKTPSSK